MWYTENNQGDNMKSEGVIQHNKKSLKLALLNAQSNLDAWKAKGSHPEKTRWVTYWENRVNELKSTKAA